MGGASAVAVALGAAAVFAGDDGGGALGLGLGGAFSVGLSKTLRTRSAIWSGTTLS